MNHVALDSQDEAVKRFIFSMVDDPQGSVVELDGRAVAWVLSAVGTDTTGDEPWTDDKNNRRCELIDRKHGDRPLTAAETLELAQLQEQMLRYRQRVAPLPIEGARELHQELLAKAARAQGSV